MKVKSKQPRKQRKALYNYKNHQRSKMFSARVADFLRDEYGIKRLPVRVGDQVRVCKGEFKDFEGEVLEITKNLRCKIKEAQFEKSDGTQFHPAIHVSNLVITKFTKEKKMDPHRANMIDRKALYGFYEEDLTAPKKSKEEENYD
jgi:large subunit ribosomal protein L24